MNFNIKPTQNEILITKLLNDNSPVENRLSGFRIIYAIQKDIKTLNIPAKKYYEKLIQRGFSEQNAKIFSEAFEKKDISIAISHIQDKISTAGSQYAAKDIKQIASEIRPKEAISTSSSDSTGRSDYEYARNGEVSRHGTADTGANNKNEQLPKSDGQMERSAAAIDTSKSNATNSHDEVVSKENGEIFTRALIKQERENAFKNLKQMIGENFTNTATSETAVLSNKGLKKMLSDKAIQKSVNNGFSPQGHINAVKNIKTLFEKSTKAGVFDDIKNKDLGLKIHRFNAEFVDKTSNTNANALLTLKEYMQNGKKIYSLELEELRRAKFNPSGKDLALYSSVKESSTTTSQSPTKASEPNFTTTPTKSQEIDLSQKVKESSYTKTKVDYSKIKTAKELQDKIKTNGDDVVDDIMQVILKGTQYFDYTGGGKYTIKSQNMRWDTIGDRVQTAVKHLEYFPNNKVKVIINGHIDKMPSQGDMIFTLNTNIGDNKGISANLTDELKDKLLEKLMPFNNKITTPKIDVREAELRATELKRILNLPSNNGEFFGSKIGTDDENARYLLSIHKNFRSVNGAKEFLVQKRKGIEKTSATLPLKEFGTNYAEFYHDGVGAVNKLLVEKQGQVAGAFYKDGLGDIDLVWGNDKFGLKHIIGKHADLNLEKLPQIIEHGDLIKQNDIRYRIQKDDYIIGLSAEYKGEKRNFIITAFQKDKGKSDTFTERPFKPTSDNVVSNLNEPNFTTPSVKSQEKQTPLQKYAMLEKRNNEARKSRYNETILEIQKLETQKAQLEQEIRKLAPNKDFDDALSDLYFTNKPLHAEYKRIEKELEYSNRSLAPFKEELEHSNIDEALGQGRITKDDYAELIALRENEEWAQEYYTDDMRAKIRRHFQKDMNIEPLKEFGTNYAEFYHDGVGAVNKLLVEKQGQVAGAFYKDGLGDIDLVWGDKNIGLSKILAKHEGDFKEFGGVDKGLDEIVNNGEVVRKNGVDTIWFKKDDEYFLVGLSKGFNGVGNNKWVITSYKKTKGAIPNKFKGNTANLSAYSDEIKGELTSSHPPLNSEPNFTTPSAKSQGTFKTNANIHITSGTVAGAYNALEIDEEGNVRFSPEKFAAGFLMGLGASSAAKKGIDTVVKRYAKSVKETYTTMAKTRPDLLEKVAKANLKQSIADEALKIGHKLNKNELISLFNKIHKQNIIAGVGANAISKVQKAKLSEAKNMLKNGADEVEIWQKTGWFLDRDNKWKFEINPKGGFLDLEKLQRKSSAKLAQILDDDELFSAYPWLKEIRVYELNDKNIVGATDAKSEIGLRLKQTSPEDIKSTLYHEIQHFVQRKEGFASGGAIDENQYFKLHGEAEARNVEHRMQEAQNADMFDDYSLDNYGLPTET